MLSQREPIYEVNWEGVGLERFMELLDTYLVRYRDERAKSDLATGAPCSTAGTWGCSRHRNLVDFSTLPQPMSQKRQKYAL